EGEVLAVVEERRRQRQEGQPAPAARPQAGDRHREEEPVNRRKGQIELRLLREVLVELPAFVELVEDVADVGAADAVLVPVERVGRIVRAVQIEEGAEDEEEQQEDEER